MTENQKFIEQIKQEVAAKRRIESEGLLEHIQKINRLQKEGKLLAVVEEEERRRKIIQARKEAIASPAAGTLIARGKNSLVDHFREKVWI